MQKSNRWFIWTIVFLVVSGVALVTYINYSSATASEADPAAWLVHHPKTLPVPTHKTVRAQ